MIAISVSDFNKYGCPVCGHSKCITDSVVGGGTYPVTCINCDTYFVKLEDGLTKASFGIIMRSDERDTITVQPELQDHPLKDKICEQIKEVKTIIDIYWIPEIVKHDISGIIRNIDSGKKILELVKCVLNNEEPDSRIDDSDPENIKFVFKRYEFDPSKLRMKVIHNKNILTKEILESAKLEQYRYRACVYKRFWGYDEFEIMAVNDDDALYKAKYFVLNNEKYNLEDYNLSDVKVIGRIDN